MKLKHVQIENYRSIQHLELKFPSSGFLVLVGPNNAGKSNIIRAIDWICGDGYSNRDKLEDHDFYNCDRSRELRIELDFNNGRKACFSSQENWPDYFDENGNKIFSSKGSVKEDFPCTYLGADRTVDKHLSFHDWTLLGRIRKRFHQQAIQLDKELQSKYAELTSIYDRVHGFSNFKKDFSRFFDEMQADTAAKLEIDFKPFTPSNYFKNMNILANDPSFERQMDLAELGEGSRNTILLALLRSYAINFKGSNGILALEEPEIFLHPQARRHLFNILRKLADDGIQVVISTHSSTFLDTEFFDSIGQVYKIRDDLLPGRFHTQICQVSKQQLVDHCIATAVPPTKVTLSSITEFYKTTSNPRLNEAFFARFVILVEGETEELALPEYLLTQGIDCDLQDISIIAVGGKNQIPKYWRLFCQFKTPLLLMFDNDEEGNSSSNNNIAKCLGLSIADIIDPQIITHKTIHSVSAPNTPVIILKKDFETALLEDLIYQLDDIEPVYEQWEMQAKDIIKPLPGQNKGQIARYIARQICHEYPNYTPSFVAGMASFIKEALHIQTPKNLPLQMDLFADAEDAF